MLSSTVYPESYHSDTLALQVPKMYCQTLRNTDTSLLGTVCFVLGKTKPLYIFSLNSTRLIRTLR